MKTRDRILLNGTAALMVAALSGCGGSVTVGAPDKIAGKEVAAKANKALEEQNPQIAHGTMKCPSMKFKINETTRCMRSATLADGRKVKVGVTVTIDRVKSGGHFKIQADSKPAEFGVDGAFIAKDLTQQYTKQFGQAPTKVDCPDLPGRVGATVKCAITSGGDTGSVEVTATRVNEAQLDTDYTFKGNDIPKP